MSIFDSIRNNLNKSIDPINEFLIDGTGTPNCENVGVVDKYTILLLAPHFKERVNQRIKSLEQFNIYLDLDDFLDKVIKEVRKRYKGYLKRSQLDDTVYPTIKRTTKLVFHAPVKLHVKDSIQDDEGNMNTIDKGKHTLDIAVITQCETLKWNSLNQNFENPSEEHQYLLDNVKYTYLNKAIKRGRLVLGSPIFTIGTIVIAYGEGDTLNGFSNHKVWKHETLQSQEVTINSEQLEKIKQIVKNTKH